MKLNYLLVLFLAIFTCCNSNRSIKVIDVKKCGLVDTTMFIKKIKEVSTARKPNSITDAIQLLDSLADDNFRCAIITFNETDLYFNLGLVIRNQWVRNGTKSIRNQLFDKLKLGYIDYSSGLILDIYKQCLINKNVDLVKMYLKDDTDSLFKMRESELKTIQKELLSLP